MAESLYELLAPHLPKSMQDDPEHPTAKTNGVTSYLSRLTTLSLSSLTTSEPQTLAQVSHTNDFSLQALSSRSHKSVISSAENLSSLRISLPRLSASAASLRDAIPELEAQANTFSTTYSKANDSNAILDRRKKAMLLSQNVDRLSDILELPSLLTSTIASASSSAGAGAASTGASTNYTTALDLFAHIKRLHILYPDSSIIRSTLLEAEDAMKDMTANLITSLRSQNIRLAAAIRTIGWLRRVAPELCSPFQTPSASTTAPSSLSASPPTASPADDSLLGSLFLTCRLSALHTTLLALTPLRDLADQETATSRQRPLSSAKPVPPTRKPSLGPSSGTQTERYLKRYIEMFRDHAFSTVSMYRNIFPAATEGSPSSTTTPAAPSPLATFPLHLTALLTSTLRQYLPNISDPAARESIVSQVLYTAASLGRLGADFGMVIADLLDSTADAAGQPDNRGEKRPKTDERETGPPGPDAGGPADEPAEHGAEAEAEPVPEWVRIMAHHRVQAGRLEALAREQEAASASASAGVTKGSVASPVT